MLQLQFVEILYGVCVWVIVNHVMVPPTEQDQILIIMALGGCLE
jgi:hypothetical protein